MKLWQALTEKSWLEEGVPSAPTESIAQRRFLSQRTALGLFLAIATILFSLFAVTYLTHSQYPGFLALTGEAWRPLGDLSQLWVNTGLLATSSLLMQWSLSSARHGKPAWSAGALLGAAFFALQFLVAQVWFWQQLNGMGYGITSNPSSSYFFLFTGAHGLHLLGGLVVLYRPLSHMWRASGALPIINSLRLCTLYWHYLLGIWLLLFLLLTRSPETYRILAALCGVEA